MGIYDQGNSEIIDDYDGVSMMKYAKSGNMNLNQFTDLSITVKKEDPFAEKELTLEEEMKQNDKMVNMVGGLRFVKADNEEFAPLEIKNDNLSDIQKQRIEKARQSKY